MDLLTLTQERFCWPGLHAACKQSAIEELLDRLLAENALPAHAREEMLDAVLQRERRLSTGLQHGIAIPHGTTGHVTREVAGLGIFPEGVPFESVDGSTTQIVILLITPEDLRHRHVTNLAHLARQLLQPDLRCALLAARSQEDVLSAIRRVGEG
ncbi:MAG: PTS sugar transporter subunit IIA [Planctomycetes bacterium]|nr:PTS sugar transporter subunit IIA [Planctomycetota bacterium]